MLLKRLVLPSADPAQNLVARDPVEERGYGSPGGIVSAPGAQQRKKRLLGHVFGNLHAACHLQGEAKNTALALPVERGKGVLVARQQPVQQLLIKLGHLKHEANSASTVILCNR